MDMGNWLDKKYVAIFVVAFVGTVVLGSVLMKPKSGALGFFSFRKSPAASSTTSPALSAAEKAKLDEFKALEQHLKNKPGHPPILFRMAQIDRENGKNTEAINLLEEILQHEPDNAEAHLELGRTLYDTGDVAGAIEQTKQILKKNPKHADALYNLGAIYANTNNIPLARDYWAKAAASAPASESGRNAQKGLQQLPRQTLSAATAQQPPAIDSSFRIPKPEDFRK